MFASVLETGLFCDDTGAGSFARALSPIPDLNGDGIAELAVGGLTSEGKFYGGVMVLALSPTGQVLSNVSINKDTGVEVCAYYSKPVNAR
eukprot:4384240-Pleurochrysis_carterae.AAC.2